MSIEIFNTLVANVSGSTVALSWTNVDPGFPPITAFAVQRKYFGAGDDGWSTIASAIAPTSPQTLNDTPGLGDWAYRVVATVTRGGVDAAGTSIYSNQVNVTTEAATGEVTVALGSKPASGIGGGLPGFTQVILGWTLAGLVPTDVRSFEIRRSINSSAFRSIAFINEFEQGASGASATWSEDLPPGIGTLSYVVVAHCPPQSSTGQLNQDFLSTSNTVSITL
jgi:hypothetical protein